MLPIIFSLKRVARVGLVNKCYWDVIEKTTMFTITKMPVRLFVCKPLLCLWFSSCYFHIYTHIYIYYIYIYIYIYANIYKFPWKRPPPKLVGNLTLYIYIYKYIYIYPQTRVSSFPRLISPARVNEQRTTGVTRVL